MTFDQIPAFIENNLNVVIETPKGSSHKYSYDDAYKSMKVSYELPSGLSFPFNFGFIPQTLAEDGDALDALVLSDTSYLSGSFLECRIVGALVIKQKKEGKYMRNDRIITVPVHSSLAKRIKVMKDIPDLPQISLFLNTYNKFRDVPFKILRQAGSDEALRLIKKAGREYVRHQTS
ncbi:MAG TPA: inorganic diphosphatase [Chryseolinea sp.]|nr:inorganic diphosphatase [Chryseolinea sp.]